LYTALVRSERVGGGDGELAGFCGDVDVLHASDLRDLFADGVLAVAAGHAGDVVGSSGDAHGVSFRSSLFYTLGGYRFSTLTRSGPRRKAAGGVPWVTPLRRAGPAFRYRSAGARQRRWTRMWLWSSCATTTTRCSPRTGAAATCSSRPCSLSPILSGACSSAPGKRP